MNSLAAAVLFGVLLLASGAVLAEPEAAGDDGFVALTDADRPTINGKTLLITAYSIILGGLALYSFSLLVRQQRLNNSAHELSRTIDKNLQDPHKTP
jgi:hypothetical protein